MRSLSFPVTGIVAVLVVVSGCERPEKPPAPAPVKASAPAPLTPSRSSSTEAELRERLRCEALLGLSGLLAGQQEFFGEKDAWTADVTRLRAPAACTDGSRVPTPDSTWLAGCHFRYAVSVAGSRLDDSTFSVRAVGVGGLAEGLTYTLTHGYVNRKPVRVWPPELVLEECHGVRRPEGTPLEAPLCEGARNLKALFTTEKSYFGEKDRYSTSVSEIGFVPEPCLDGSRAPVPDDSWTAGCRFIYRAEVSGTAPEQTFRLTARGMTGTVAEQTLTLDSQGTWSPADPGCAP